jgi:hypothetical protein
VGRNYTILISVTYTGWLLSIMSALWLTIREVSLWVWTSPHQGCCCTTLITTQSIIQLPRYKASLCFSIFAGLRISDLVPSHNVRPPNPNSRPEGLHPLGDPVVSSTRTTCHSQFGFIKGSLLTITTICIAINDVTSWSQFHRKNLTVYALSAVGHITTISLTAGK